MSPSIRYARKLAEAVAGLVWPRVCWLCDGPVPPNTSDGSLCPACRVAVLLDPHSTCPRCTSTVGPHTTITDGCTRCRGVTYRFAGAVRLGPYDGLLREAILRMKAAAGEPLAETLGRLWAVQRAEQLRSGRPTVVVPVPLNWRRRWHRGYNQAEAVARGLSGGLGLPCRPAALVRSRVTPTQRDRSPTDRWANVKDAFRPGRGVGVRGETVLLVDDVLTTGATADAAATALMTAGAAQVRVAVLAHR